MRLAYDREADAVYVALREVERVERTAALDDRRLIDDVGAEPVGVELLGVSHGVRLDDLPEAAAIARLLAEQHVLVFAEPARMRSSRSISRKLPTSPW